MAWERAHGQSLYRHSPDLSNGPARRRVSRLDRAAASLRIPMRTLASTDSLAGVRSPFPQG